MNPDEKEGQENGGGDGCELSDGGIRRGVAGCRNIQEQQTGEEDEDGS